MYSRFAANSGLFARIERAKMPKRAANKPKSSFLNLLAVKSKQLLSGHYKFEECSYSPNIESPKWGESLSYGRLNETKRREIQ